MRSRRDLRSEIEELAQQLAGMGWERTPMSEWTEAQQRAWCAAGTASNRGDLEARRRMVDYMEWLLDQPLEDEQ